MQVAACLDRDLRLEPVSNSASCAEVTHILAILADEKPGPVFSLIKAHSFRVNSYVI
jgi:hypothetical protein